MTNTTHISSLAGSQTNRQGDTGVICFCHRHRNSLPTPLGVDKAGLHSLACRLGGICSCCDYLPLQRKGFLLGPMEKCCSLPSAMISTPAGSWVSLEGKSVQTRQGISTGCTALAVIITAYSGAPTLTAHVPVWG